MAPAASTKRYAQVYTAQVQWVARWPAMACEQVVLNVPTGIAIRYPIAPIQGSANPQDAARFVDHVLSPSGQTILRRRGFETP